MIILDQVVKLGAKTKKEILSSISLAIPTNRSIALLGPSEEDKRKLIDVLAGTTLVNSGRVIRNAQLSFPVGTLPPFERTLSIRKNVEHTARIYGTDPRSTVDFIRRILNVGNRFDKPLAALSRTEQKVLALILPFSIPFDAYLVLGDNMEPNHISWELFRARQRMAGMIISTKKAQFAQDNCDMALVLIKGQLTLFDRVEEGLARMSKL